jgi:CheY-like chemotaxis protein
MNLPQRPQPLILVVDYDQVVLDELTAMLTASGFACQCCTTSESAVAAAELLRPDLILSDVALPEAGGVEMTHRIHENPALADVPVMFLSAGQIPDIIRRSDGGHGAYFLRKPPDPGVLVELVDRALKRGWSAADQPGPADAAPPLTLPLAAE